MNRRKFLISVPYIYPVCPLSIDHAKIMLVADIYARMSRLDGKDVYFPIAAHYSGITAEKTIKNLNSSDLNVRNQERDKYLKLYKTPRKIVDEFKKAEDILDYYSAQTIFDLKRLNISCNFDCFYRTNEPDYELFIKSMFKSYENSNVLVKNSKNELSLNYDDKEWNTLTLKNLHNLTIINPKLKNNIISSFKNIRSDWGILRNYGLGVKYKDNYVIDPMFDSELFVVYDLFKKFIKSNKINGKNKFFDELFLALKSKQYDKSQNDIICKIVNWLPTDIFVCEEHLKNWVIKKTFAESLLFDEEYQTRKYFITGMGYINGERMSSSKGTAILLKDLIDCYGSTITRMIIMFCGGHPSKMYNYTNSNVEIVKNLLNDFNDYITYINSKLLGIEDEKNVGYIDEFNSIKSQLEDGYYQQTIVDLMKNIKKKYTDVPNQELLKMKNTLKYFMSILLPDLKI